MFNLLIGCWGQGGACIKCSGSGQLEYYSHQMLHDAVLIVQPSWKLVHGRQCMEPLAG